MSGPLIFVVVAWAAWFVIVGIGWAVIRRRRPIRDMRRHIAEGERAVRIASLEHSLGLTPCSYPWCSKCHEDGDSVIVDLVALEWRKW